MQCSSLIIKVSLRCINSGLCFKTVHKLGNGTNRLKLNQNSRRLRPPSKNNQIKSEHMTSPAQTAPSLRSMKTYHWTRVLAVRLLLLALKWRSMQRLYKTNQMSILVCVLLSQVFVGYVCFVCSACLKDNGHYWYCQRLVFSVGVSQYFIHKITSL